MFCSAACAKCVASPRGLTCCRQGGSWHGNCGHPGDNRFEHTWDEGLEVCGSTTKKPPVPTRRTEQCAICVSSKDGFTCCGEGGSWHGNCGHPGSDSVEHTFNEGFEACGSRTPKPTARATTKPTTTRTTRATTKPTTRATTKPTTKPTTRMLLYAYYF